jgi:ubiquitin
MIIPQSPEDNASPATPGFSSLHTQLITFYGQVITVNLSEDEIVEDVKVKIDRKEGIPVEQQLLFFAGQQLEDDKPLTFYQIFNSSASETSRHLVLRLRDGMKIFVKTLSDKTIEVQVDPSETIEIVKVKIHEQEGISPCDQRLLQDGRDLGDLRTLSDYGIKHKSTLQLDLHLGGPCPICQSQFRNSSTNTPIAFPGSVSPPSSTRNSSGKGAGHSFLHSSSVSTSCSATNITNSSSAGTSSPPSSPICSPRK